MLRLGKLKTAKKSAVLLLAALVVLLVVSFLPFGNDGSGKEKSALLLQQIQELNSLSPAVDEKIDPQVKEQVKEALYAASAAKTEDEKEQKRKVVVVVEAQGAIEDEVKKAGGSISKRADSVDKETEFVAIEIDAGEVDEFAQSDDVVKVYPKVVYYPMLNESVPLIRAEAFWNAGYTGSGVKVAVLDTGIDKNHPMLQGKVAAERDFSNSGSADDKFGHGTHVAGIVAGATANGGAYSGVAPGAQILNAKVIGDDGIGDNLNVIAGIGWAVDNGAKVISMSLGAPTALDSSVENAIKDAVAKGVVVVVSSGNCGNGCPSAKCGSFRGVTSPGNSANVITIGAVDKARNTACFSSGGTIPGVGIKPDFVAPGVSIRSSVPNGGYASSSGTSMSAPHVSGAAALLLSKNQQLRQDDIKRVLERTSLDLGDIGKDTSYGYGLIDLAKALIYKEGLEFVVQLDRQVVSGSTQRISVTISDDVPVNNVTAAVTRPDSAKAQLNFAAPAIGSNAYSLYYNDTGLLGSYAADILVNYGGSSGGSDISGSGKTDTPSVTAYQTAAFKVVSLLGEFGNVEQINVSESLLGKNLTANITLVNSAATALNFSTLLQLLLISNGTVAAAPSQEIRLPIATVAANSKSAITVNRQLEVGPGDYAFRILTDYDAGSLINETNITIIDDLAPRIISASYRSRIAINNPQVFVARLSEHSNLSSVILYDAALKPVNVNYTVRTVSELGREKEVAVTVFDGLSSSSAYDWQLGICDEWGNCAATGALHFEVSGCTGKQVLVVKTYEQVSLFEEVAASYSNVCLSVLNRSLTATPPDSYLERFDAVVWSTSTDMANIDDNDAAALASYYSKKTGRIAVEGSDVAFRHNNDDFMRTVLRSELEGDLGFTVTSAANMSKLSISLTRPHPAVNGFESQSQLFFNATIDPFPDAVQPYNGSVELAAWKGLDTNGSAIVAYESEDRKSLFLPFSIAALDSSSAKTLVSNALSWLLGAVQLDIMPAQLSSSFPVEGQISLSAAVQSTERLQASPEMKVFADGNAVSAGPLSLETSQPATEPGLYSYPFAANLSVGEHVIKIVANSKFSLEESNYVNNVKEYPLTVYPAEADLLFAGLSYAYDDSLGAIVVDVNVSDMGGTPAASTLRAYLENNETASQVVQLAAGETKQVKLRLASGKGTYSFRAVIDADNGVAEYNESNNELRATIYVCSKEKVLVVDDNDAELFSTAEPSSSDEFLEMLRSSGYCVEAWDEKQQGAPGSSELNNFKVVVWSAGDYFNGTLSSEDLDAIANYTGGLLLEGSDLGLDHTDSTVLQQLTGAEFLSDLLLSDNDTGTGSLVLKPHPITANISALSIGRNNSPYPDAVELVDSDAVAEWRNGSNAITARNLSKGRRSAYYAFSVDGITDNRARENLVLNTVQWLLEGVNTPPQIRNLANATVSEGEALLIQINATDADGDNITFGTNAGSILPSPFTFNETSGVFAWTPEFNDSGNYTVLFNASDGQSVANSTINITVHNTNRAPIMQPIGNFTVIETEIVALTLTGVSPVIVFSDPDNENSVVNDDNNLTVSINDARFVRNSTAFGWKTTADDSGTYGFKAAVSDGSLNQSKEFNITVQNLNRPPTLAFIPNATGNENSTISVAVNATDSDNENSVTNDDNALAFAINDSRFVLNNSAFAFAAGFDDAGIIVVSIGVSDGEFADSQEVRIEIMNVNRQPRITTVPITNAAEEQPYAYDVEAEDDDLATRTGDALVFSLLEAPQNMSINSTTGVITWVPANRQAEGNHAVTVRVSDALGSVDAQSYVITATNVNDAPSVNSTAVTEAVEEATYIYNVDSDDDDFRTMNPSEVHIYSLVTAPAGMTINSSSGIIAWTPTNEQSAGNHTVTVNVTDSAGAANAQSYSVFVANANDYPLINSTPALNATEENLYTYDADADDDDLRTMNPTEAHLFTLDNAPAGMAINATTGMVSWTPTNEQSEGTHTIAVIVTDSAGAAGNQTFAISVANVNDEPLINSTPITAATEEKLYTYNVDGDDDDFRTLNPTEAHTYAFVTAPSGMAINGSTGAIMWMPANEQAGGSHNVTIAVTDRAGSTGIQTYSVAVENVNDKPVINSTPITEATEEEPYTYDVGSDDDDFRTLKPDETHTYSLAAAPAGMAINSFTGLITWTPSNGQAQGIHLVVVSVTDSGGLAASQNYTIYVHNVNDMPVVISMPLANASEEQLYTYDVDSDDDDFRTLNPTEAHSYSLVTAPEGMAMDSFTGAIVWTPTNAQAQGGHSVAVKVTDSSGADGTQNFTVTVANVNDPPIITSTPPVNVTNEQELFTYNVEAADDDFNTMAPNEVHAYSLKKAPAGMTIQSSTGMIEWVPATEQAFSTHDIIMRVTDAEGASDEQNFSVFVIDTTPPAIAIKSAPSGFVNSDGIVSFEVFELHDDKPAVVITPTPIAFAKTSFANNVSTYVANYTAEGFYEVVITATDQSGNTAVNSSVAFAIDKTPPITSDNLGNPHKDWHKVDIIVSLNSTDPASGGVAAGVKETFFIIYQDGVAGPTTALSAEAPVITYEDDDNWIEYWSVDAAGNEEEHTFVKNIKLDKTAPFINLALYPLLPEYPNNESLPAALEVFDPIVQGTPSNNVNTTIYLDGKVISNVTGLNITLLLGRHSVTVSANDLAGNENTATISFTVFLQLTPGQIFITPRSLKINRGVMTAHIRFPGLENASQIFNFTLDGAPYESAEGKSADNDDGDDGQDQDQQLSVHFRRQAVADAVAAANKTLDTHFVLEGWVYYNDQPVKVAGSDEIKKIIGHLDDEEEHNEKQGKEKSKREERSINKSINIILSYNHGTPFDANDDGIENVTGAVDFTVAGTAGTPGTSFSWPVNESSLCTLWSTYSAENKTAALVCHGSAKCCALSQLLPSAEAWSESFITFYGRHGAAHNNTISAQVVYADYSLQPDDVYSGIVYSDWASLNATFLEPQAGLTAANQSGYNKDKKKDEKVKEAGKNNSNNDNSNGKNSNGGEGKGKR